MDTGLGWHLIADDLRDSYVVTPPAFAPRRQGLFGSYPARVKDPRFMRLLLAQVDLGAEHLTACYAEFERRYGSWL